MEAVMRENGFYPVTLYEEGSDFAQALEGWCLGLFEEYQPEPLQGMNEEAELPGCEQVQGRG